MIVSLLLAMLAIYRVAHMVAFEDGPFDVFSRLREQVGQASWVGRGLHCPLCISFWLAWLGALAVGTAGVVEYILTALGLAGAVLVLHLTLYEGG